MKKHIIIFFALFMLAFTVHGNQKKAYVPKQDFGFTRYIAYNPLVTDEIKKEIAPAFHGLSRNDSIALMIVGAVLIGVGITSWVSGIVMVYFSALGLGWISNSRYRVTFLNGDQTWGLLGIGFGYAFIGLGVALCVVGVILLVYAIINLKSDNARMFIEPGDTPETASVGIALKL